MSACAEIPFAWRDAHAIAAYTCFRPGELRVLTFGDLELEAKSVNVTKAWDYRVALPTLR